MKNFTAGKYPHEIQGTLIKQGNDLIFLISGGTQPHIGAISIAYPDVVTVVGIHVDNASNFDIETLQKNFADMLEKTLNEE